MRVLPAWVMCHAGVCAVTQGVNAPTYDNVGMWDDISCTSINKFVCGVLVGEPLLARWWPRQANSG